MILRIAKFLIVLGFCLAIVVGIGVYVLWKDMQQAMDTPIGIADSEIYELKKGTNVRALSIAMENNGWIREALFFELEVRRLKLANQLKAGAYQVYSDETPRELLVRFTEGDTVKYFISFIEGMTFKQVLEVLAENKSLIHTLENMQLDEITRAVSPSLASLEGWVFPASYQFESNTQDIEILKRAHNKMNDILKKHWEARRPELPYETPAEALTMASIIEKETGQAAERKQIAGVFVRRLNKGMKLQTDPTVIYGLGDKFDGNLRRKDLRTDTPYNTYTRHGLPPTPIAMPGEASIEAALQPAAGKSLFFVAKGNGWHQFSDDLAAHNEAVRKYQLKK